MTEPTAGSLEAVQAVRRIVAAANRSSDLREACRELDAVQQPLRRALERKGYRESCDIPACNCGDQWNHGGNAETRLSEIHEALGWEVTQGKTALEAITALQNERERLASALTTSVELQSHYAGLLNMYDGGKRHQFKDGDAWLARLAALAPTDSSLSRRPLEGSSE